MTRARRTAAPARELEDVGFFVLRTPLLSREQVWGAVPARAPGGGAAAGATGDDRYDQDVATLRAAMCAALHDPCVREAIHVASPRIAAAIDGYLAAPTTPASRELEPVLVRYLSRMSSRPTPFGLFAGSAVGRVGGESRLHRSPRAALGRASYLDSGWLMHLCARLSTRDVARGPLRFVPSSSSYRVAGSWRWAEPQQLAGRSVYRLASAEDCAEIRVVLERARGGATRAELGLALRAAMTAAGEETSDEDVAAFVDELVDSHLLMPQLAPAVTGGSPMPALRAQLRTLGGFEREVAALQSAEDQLAQLDERGLGAAPARYAGIVASLPPEMADPQAVRVDMRDDATDITLSQAVVDEVARAVWMLDALHPAVNHHLERFKQQFVERYGARTVPLCEALDEEVGIGFERGSEIDIAPQPLFLGLQLGARTARATPPPFEPHHAVMLRLLEELEATGGDELRLEQATLESLRVARPHRPAASVSAVIRFSGAPEDLDLGRARVLVQAFAGPPGGMHLARLAHALPALVEPLRELARREQAWHPQATFAEVVHAPEGGFATVVRRPLLRPAEIEYLGVSGAAPEQRIGIDDLDVSVRGDRVVLTSRRLGREVIPRLTSAHTYDARRNLAVYRFLGTMQHNDGASGLGWSWGPLEARRFLPRVSIGRVVVARARWRIDDAQLRSLSAPTPRARFDALQALRSALRLPRFVTCGEADQLLTIDLDNALLCDALLDDLAGAREMVLTEAFPAPGDDPVHGPEGAYAHEVVLPLVRPAPPAAAQPSVAMTTTARAACVHAPGGEWLCARLFASPRTVDDLLDQVVTPLVAGARAQAACDGWFFIRYDAPAWHLRLRLRLQGEPRRLWGELLPALHARVQPWLADGRVARMELACYEPELERYGGAHALALVERIFEADSDACLELLGVAARRGDEQLRWRMALLGVDRLLGDLGHDDESRHVFAARHRAAFAREHAADVTLERALGARFRPRRRELEALLDGADGPAAREALRILAVRSERIQPLHRALVDQERSGALAVPRSAIVESVVHMFVNRMSRSGPRAQEYVLHDMLERLYEGRLARARRAG